MKREPPAPASSDPVGRIPVEPVREALLAHYDSAARELPWRGDLDPYRVLVSEVMLQQTRVETVKRYYDPWLERFPNVAALADADEDEVLKAWEGLGYYRRARNLHRAARAVRERPDRAIPSNLVDLRALPGVGEYTAGAVASIAFGEVEPAVDGNVRRVLSRLFDRSRPKPGWLRRAATELVDPLRPGDWNQALMELGATVCTPTGPDCGACPVAPWCAAFAAGTVEDRPGRAERREVRKVRVALGLFCRLDDPTRVLLTRRPEDGLLGGLWAFPEVEVGENGRPSAEDPSPPGGATVENAGPCVVADAAARLAGSLGLATCGRFVRLPECEHRFTHLHAVYVPLAATVVEARGLPAEARWASHEQAAELALPVAQRRVLDSWHDLMVERHATPRGPRRGTEGTGR